jgi:hypothetical protein
MQKNTETPIRLLIRKCLNEMAIIKPYDFSSYIDKLKKSENNVSNLKDINNIFKGSEIYFSNFDTYFETLTNEKEKIVAPKDLMLMGGVKFALYNTNIDKINVVVEPSLFFDFINSRQNKEHFYEFLNLVLRHESIHLQQVSKMGKDKYVLDASPTVNTKKYWSSQYEIMAYAQSLVDDLHNQGHSDKEIEIFLREPENTENIGSWIYNVYKKVLNKEQYKKFKKYAYLYTKNI